MIMIQQTVFGFKIAAAKAAIPRLGVVRAGGGQQNDGGTGVGLAPDGIRG